MIREKRNRVLYFFSKKRALRGLTIASSRCSSKSDRNLAFEKLDAALGLVEKYTPEKFRALQSDVDSILVAGLPTALGSYLHGLRMIEIQTEYVEDSETTPELLACLLIHEAQHARLDRLGFGYDEPIRGRIERLCHHAHKIFALRLSDGETLAADAEAWMEADPDTYYSNYALDQSRRDALAEIGCPNWLLKLVDKKIKRRHSKSTSEQ